MFFNFLRNKKTSRKEDKKVTLDEILKGIDDLPDEEKAKIKAKMDDLYKAEDEREIDKIEEDKSEDSEKKDEKSEEVDEESKEIGKDVDEVEEEVHKDGDLETEEDRDDAEENHEEEHEEKSSTPLEKLIRDAVAQEVKAAFVAMTKPSAEETEPTPASEKERKALASFDAIYNS